MHASHYAKGFRLLKLILSDLLPIYFLSLYCIHNVICPLEYDKYASKIRLEFLHIEEKRFYQRRAQVYPTHSRTAVETCLVDTWNNITKS